MAERDLRIQTRLKEALIRKGLSEEEAYHISNSADFLGNLTEETFEADRRDVFIIATAYASLASRHKKTEHAPMPTAEHEADDTYTSLEKVYPKENEKPKNSISQFERRLAEFPDWFRYFSVYSLVFLLSLATALLISSVVILSIASIAGMILLSIAGVIFFLVGLLYGVSQLSTFAAAGFYEVGLGLILGGASVLLVILLYNLLTLILPYLRRTLFKIIIKKIKYLIHIVNNKGRSRS